ncbi:MAG: hypothetical protein E7437_06485 [Ruminococcaceae bacterium]|nr:hypothetical protein [Oscillospiraceae bacterium]
MQVFSPLMSRSNSRLVRALAFVLPMVVLLTGLLSQTVSAENTFVITDGESVTVYTGNDTDPARVLAQAGVELRDDDFYTHEESDGVSRITVRRCQTVTVDNCGQVTEIRSYGESVSTLLTRMGVEHIGEYALNVGLDAKTYDGMRIVVSSMFTQEQNYAKQVPYEVIQREDPRMALGSEAVIQQGRDGEAICTALVTYKDGTEVDRKVVYENVITEPVNEIIVRGTGEAVEEQTYPIIGDGYIILQTGEVLTYTHTDTFMATAYTSWIEDVIDMTATGTHARHGAVAVDPKVIPYGTRMFIVTADGEFVYGLATAEDCGGGVKGKHIDLFFETLAECNFGRQDITVYFLGEADWRGRQYRTGIGFIE